MTGREYIRQSIALFEESLAAGDGATPIRTVTELARRTGYSVHHFTRLFSAVTGSSPKDYISGRILSEAARRIAETNKGLDGRLVGVPDDQDVAESLQPGQPRFIARRQLDGEGFPRPDLPDFRTRYLHCILHTSHHAGETRDLP